MDNGSTTSDPVAARGNASPSPTREKSAPPLHDTAFVTEEFLPYLLHQTTNTWDRKWKRALKRSSVNTRQWRVLSILNRSPGLSLTELMERTAIDQPTLSRMIDQLSGLGMVKREISEQDARFLRLSLTERGEALVEEIWPIAWANYRIGVADLMPEEEALLIKLLKRVLDSLQAD
ncbi:MarR family transcriptional regulator [Nocardia sp. R7R-8]|uniref:MarR family transcriptional regulator n=1 Tax=Nocardia sp. R7R-8 TaxID=3459304 RepID=UPI00403D9473